MLISKFILAAYNLGKLSPLDFILFFFRLGVILIAVINSAEIWFLGLTCSLKM